MASSYISYSQYDSLTKPVEFNSSQFNIAAKNLQNELLKYYAKRMPVYLDLGKSYTDLCPAGTLTRVYNNTVSIQLLDNQYGRFVREMLYKAIDLNVSVVGLGEISQTEILKKFKINRLVITNYVKWF